jgi:hypothetical protein
MPKYFIDHEESSRLHAQASWLRLVLQIERSAAHDANRIRRTLEEVFTAPGWLERELRYAASTPVALVFSENGHAPLDFKNNVVIQLEVDPAALNRTDLARAELLRFLRSPRLDMAFERAQRERVSVYVMPSQPADGRSVA